MAVESIALPPLGCGNGGLQRHDVRREIETAFAGVEGVLGMELLATVDWLLHERGCEPTVPALRAALATWPGGADAGERKLRLFDERRLGLALDRLADSPVAQPARLC